MKANQATFPVRVMSRLLGVSASGFYAWVQRPLSARAVEDIGLTALIHAIHRRSNGAYGAPSIHAELADDHNRRVGKKRVARLMRAAGLRGLHPRRFVTTTIGDPASDRALDHVDRTLRLRALTASGWPTSPISRRGPGFSISPSCSMCGRDGSRLGNRTAPQDRARPERAEHGTCAAAPPGRHPSFGSRLSVHQLRLRQTLSGSWRDAVDGVHRGRLR